MTSSTATTLESDRLIDSHPEAARIRRVQRIAYRAFSHRHKLGLDALSFLMGPMGMVGFVMVDDHRDKEAFRCEQELEQLLQKLDNSVRDRRIVSLLLADYPGRFPAGVQMLQDFLRRAH